MDACGHGGRPPPAPRQGETRSEVGQAEVRRPGGPRCHARRLAIRIHSAVRAGCWAPSGATFISCPFSGALGKWEMGGIWMGCLMQGSTKPAALSGWPQSLPGIGASSVPWRWHLQGSRSLTIGSTPSWENSAARWGQPAPTRDPPPTEADGSVVEQERVSRARMPAGSGGRGWPRSCMKAHGGRDGNVYIPIVKLGFSQNFRSRCQGEKWVCGAQSRE